MRKHGFIVTDGPDGHTEMAAHTCCHCQRVVVIPHRAPPEDCGGFCRHCMRMTCKSCAMKPCVPFMKRLDDYEKRAASLKSMGML